MTEPQDPTATDTDTEAEAHLHAGPRDEGGHGGMATRELEAHEAEED